MNKYCLVTSRDEKYWDETAPLIFLDAGCLGYDQQKKLKEKKRDYIIYKSRFEDFEEYKKGQKYIIDLCDRLIDDYCESLNTIHRVEYDIKSWGILLRWWLLSYLSYYYYRFTVISDIIKCCDVFSLDISYNDDHAFVFGEDFLEQAINSDFYNTYAGTRLLKSIGISVRSCPQNAFKSEMGTDTSAIQPKDKYKFFSGTNFLVTHFYRVIEKISSNNDYVLYGNPLELDLWNLIKTSIFGDFCHINISRKEIIPEITTVNKDDKIRQKIHFRSINNDSVFERIISNYLRNDTPIAYLEGFHVIREQAVAYFGKGKKRFYSHNAWMNDEFAKSFIASERSNGMILYGIQHGGGGIHVEDTGVNDLRLTDVYYSWGWNRKENDNVCIAMPSPKLSRGLRDFPLINPKERNCILFIGNLDTSYLRRFHFFPLTVNTYKYIEEQINIIKEFSILFDDFRCRLYHTDYGWEMKKRVVDNTQRVVFDENTNLLESLKNTKLCVIDHLITSWSEVYVRGVPFIIIISKEMEDYPDEIKSNIEELKDVGVYYNDLDKAIATVKAIENNTFEWWLDAKRKKTVESFANMYSRHSSKWQKKWIEEIKKENIYISYGREKN